MASNSYSWAKSGSNPLFGSALHWNGKAPNNPCVLKHPETGKPVTVNGSYWLLYDPGGVGIASSSDLVSWSNDANSPLLDATDANAEAWESGGGPGAHCFLYLENEPEPFWIFYHGLDSNDNRAIGIATSDTVNSGYTRLTSYNPIIPSDFFSEGNGAEDFQLQRGTDGTWRAVCEANSVTSGVAVKCITTTNTLPRDGWTNHGDLLSSDSGYKFVANPCLIRRDFGGGTYYDCYYEGVRGSGDNDGLYAWVAEADFTTPSNWTIIGPIVTPTASWEGSSVVPNGVVLTDTEDHAVFYTGNSGTSKQIGRTNGSWTEVQRALNAAGAQVSDGGAAQTSLVQLIDDFEDNDLSEYTVVNGSPTTTSARAFAGSYSLELFDSGGAREDIKSYSGLSNYPARGDNIESQWYLKSDGTQTGKTFVIFGSNDSGFPDQGYGFRIQPSQSDIEIFKRGPNTILSNTSVTVPEDEWLKARIETTSSALSFELFDSAGNSLAKTSASDSEYTSGGILIGSAHDGNDAATTYFDEAKIV